MFLYIIFSLKKIISDFKKITEIKRPSKTYESKLSDHLKNESVSQHQIEDKESFGSLALTLTWIVKCKLDIDSSLKGNFTVIYY